MVVFIALAISLSCLATREKKLPKVIKNSIGMKLVPVPACDSKMGRDALSETFAVAYPWIRSTRCPNLIEVGYTSKL
ncbi:hypothetical protein SAMN05216299_12148 [Nitrosospira sp. Nsp14]|nr:hypothetical protein SAMN05216299_12148 [Nitrosospira sp. Nsp14]